LRLFEDAKQHYCKLAKAHGIEAVLIEFKNVVDGSTNEK